MILAPYPRSRDTQNPRKKPLENEKKIKNKDFFLKNRLIGFNRCLAGD